MTRQLLSLAFACTLGCGDASVVDETSGSSGSSGTEPTVEGAAGKSDSASSKAFYISASSLERLNGSLATVKPAVQNADASHSPEFYLDRDGPLGAIGPLSAWGPLGALGPLGDATWNPSWWLSAIPTAVWDEWCEDLGGTGPLSEQGPLGPSGPLSAASYKALAAWPNEAGHNNDFVKQLQTGGVWSILGPLGPLGALGPLGPLGPVGAHCARGARGFEPNAAGDYVTGAGKIVRTVAVPYAGKSRTFELLESYTEARAKAMKDNDTSFMVLGSLDVTVAESDTFAFKSRVTQYVSLLVVPENALSDFDLELLDAKGKVVARSNSDGRQVLAFGVPITTGHYVDFITSRMASGSRWSARVTAKTTNRVFPGYRLIVVGSTGDFKTTDIKGAHQIGL